MAKEKENWVLNILKQEKIKKIFENMTEANRYDMSLVASTCGALKIVKKLLEKNFITESEGKLQVLLTHASFKGHSEIAEFLIKKGANVNFPRQE